MKGPSLVRGNKDGVTALGATKQRGPRSVMEKKNSDFPER